MEGEQGAWGGVGQDSNCPVSGLAPDHGLPESSSLSLPIIYTDFSAPTPCKHNQNWQGVYEICKDPNPYESGVKLTNFIFSWQRGELWLGQKCCTHLLTQNEGLSKRIGANMWQGGHICPPSWKCSEKSFEVEGRLPFLVKMCIGGKAPTQPMPEFEVETY